MSLARVLVLDPSQMQPFEIGARLAGALAYPNPGEERQAHLASVAYCCETMRLTGFVAPELAGQLKEDCPLYHALPQEEQDKVLRTTERRFRHRMMVAKIVRPFISEAVTTRPARLPTGMQRLTLRQIFIYVAPEARQSDPANVRRRIWKLGKPVAHLAAAIELAALDSGSTSRVIAYDLANEALQHKVCRMAGQIAEILYADKRAQVKRGQLLHLHWA